VGGNKIPLGLGEAPAATRGPIGFLLERKEGFLGKIIMSLRMDVLRKILTRVARREVGDQSHVGGSLNEGMPTVRTRSCGGRTFHGGGIPADTDTWAKVVQCSGAQVNGMLVCSGASSHSTSMIRLCKKTWTPAVQALSRAFSTRYARA
jgi:hypothetical protein